MTRKDTSLSKTVAAVAFVGLLAGGPQVLAQSSSPGEGNRPPETGAPAAAPQASPAQPESGATGPGSVTVGRVPGHTGQISTVQPKADPMVQESEKEVSKRIKNICRGC